MQPAYASGRAETARRWLGWFEDQGVIERYPLIAFLGAEAHALLGQPATAERLAAAERALAGEAPPRARSPGSWRGSPTSWTAMPTGPTRSSPTPSTPSRSSAGCPGRPPQPPVAPCGDRRQDWDEAETLARRALEIVRDGHLDDYIMSPLVHAVVARTALHRGDLARAQEHLARAARLRPLLTYAVPHFAVLTLHDPAGARTVLRQARDILRLRPDLGILPRQAEERRERLDAVQGGTVGPSSLPTAELRLLPLLSTHLSFKEIGGRLHVSRHTVKSQAISVYRKLGVSSRGEAIARVRELGLLGS